MQIHEYPLGPNLRKWLSISEDQYKGQEKQNVTEDEKQQVIQYIIDYGKNHQLETEDDLIELIDELVAMGLPSAALSLIDINEETWTQENFRGVLSEGIAAMLMQDLERAEESFFLAQHLIPEEPAPYINIVKIMLFTDRPKEAKTWCSTGLDAEPNNHTLWELFYEILSVISPDNMETEFKEKVKTLNSWSGASLIVAMNNPDNHQARLDALKGFYEEGEKGEDFLIEYTGALGAAGDFAKIPQIIWLSKSSQANQISWKLEMHEAQAYLAMGKSEDFIKVSEGILKRKDIPDDVQHQLQELIQEEKKLLHH